MQSMQTDLATLDRLLDTALDLPCEAREQWIESLPPEHDTIKPRLRALLSRAVQVETSDFLSTLPKFDAGVDAATERGGEASGDQVGPYRLIREIGAGGMGAVWLAERQDGALKRAVALKFLRAHGPREALGERLARERDILAGLVHPGIARLYDAGMTSDGLPFLVLEYIEGEHIDEYCSGRGLDVTGRLGLFLQVARAVAFAHGKLVVHRDLKPANILVSADGQVHLLDFGIAKLLEDGQALETELTQGAGRALTPEYAAPEQLTGEPITIAADVYSLGVILYQLLAQARPYKLKRSSRGALEEAILVTEPKRPSESVEDQSLRRRLRGDLDAIVLKALKKKPEDRYITVNAFADDIEHHLQGRPVVAQPDRAAYRAAKFIRRNSLPVAATALVLVSIVAGAVVSVWQKHEADAQRDAALLSQRRAEAYGEFMSTLLQDAGPGRSLTATELLDRGTRILDRQQEFDESVAAYVRYEISRNYLLFNQTERELALLERSAEGARRIGDDALLAATRCSAAWSLARRGAVPDARAKFAEAERSLVKASTPPSYAIADCLRARSAILAASGDVPGAIDVLEKGIPALQANPAGTWRAELVLAQLSDLYRATDRFKDALRLSEESLRSVRASGRADSLEELTALNNYAGNLYRLGEITRASDLYRQSVEWVEKSTLADVQPVAIRSNYGNSLLRLGNAQRALELADEDLLLATNAGSIQAAALCHFLAARALHHLGRSDESDARLQQAELTWHSDTKMFGRMLREAAVHRADVELSKGRLQDALTTIDAALASTGYPEKKTAPGLDRAMRLASQIHRLTGDAAGAERLATEALEYSRRIARDERESADVGQAALLRAEAHAVLGRIVEAREDASLAVDALRSGLGADHADTLAATGLLASLR
jgi:serine/threonine protein kinase/tetratricopeptide (TPR) repeat protein